MRTDKGLIAIDWGTTNRRVYVLDAAGAVRHRAAEACGVLAVPPGGFPAAVAELRARFGDLPMLLAGMVGSNRGWVEAPYVECPLDLARLADMLAVTDDRAAFIVPGVKDCADGRADVMRGEEVQLLGAIAAGLMPGDAGCCHPGTHAKWAIHHGGALRAFRTVMTGELFALLRQHSILSAQMQAEVTPGAAFREAVRRALARPELSADLFSVRARVLLGSLAQEDAADHASGLLIGADVAIGLRFLDGDGPVALIGDPALTALYAAALGEAGRECYAIDGEDAFLAGIRAIAERLS